MESCKKLILLIAENPLFNVEDRSVLKKVIYRLSLDKVEGVEDVNDKIKGQVELESNMLYLLGTYRSILMDLDLELDILESNAVLEVPAKNIEGYRTGVREAKAYLSTDEEIGAARLKRNYCKNLCADLENLFKIVLGRNDKLNQLSNNYRRELSVDSRN